LVNRIPEPVDKLEGKIDIASEREIGQLGSEVKNLSVED